MKKTLPNASVKMLFKCQANSFIIHTSLYNKQLLSPTNRCKRTKHKNIMPRASCY